MEQESVIMELYEKVEQEKDNSSEYTLILKEFNELREQFDSNINEEQQKELQTLLYLYGEMCTIECKEYFKEGFSKGVKLMTEVLCKEKEDKKDKE